MVVIFTVAGLMYYIHWDYQINKVEEQWHIEFMKKFKPNSKEYECYKIFQETGNSKEYECYKIFQETGYSPRYCN